MSLLAAYNLPFLIAFGAMLAVLVLQFLGLGEFDLDADLDADTDGVADAGSVGVGGALVTLLGLGRVPLLVWLMVFLLLFGVFGLTLQAFAIDLVGGPLHGLIAGAIAAAGAVPVTAAVVRPLGRLLPGDETSAVRLDSLVGRRGTIATGRAAAGYPARARVRDRHGHAHFVMVEPHEAGSEMLEGDELLIVRREGQTFFAVPLTERKLAPVS